MTLSGHVNRHHKLDRYMNIKNVMKSIGVKAKAAAQVLSNTDGEKKNKGLQAIASSLRDCRAEIIAANNMDMESSEKKMERKN